MLPEVVDQLPQGLQRQPVCRIGTLLDELFRRCGIQPGGSVEGLQRASDRRICQLYSPAIDYRGQASRPFHCHNRGPSRVHSKTQPDAG
jgi:hypothetical protein